MRSGWSRRRCAGVATACGCEVWLGSRDASIRRGRRPRPARPAAACRSGATTPCTTPDAGATPAGTSRPGEDFVSAAVRELREETGLVVEPERLASLGVRRFRSESCGEDDEFELFAVRLSIGDDDVVCGEGRQMVFVDPQALGGRPLHQATALTLDRVQEWQATAVRTDFVQVTLVDPRGRVLMQERDEHAPVWPEMWCFPGGGLEEGEAPVDGRLPRAGRGDRRRGRTRGPHRPRALRARHRRPRHVPVPRLRRPDDAQRPRRRVPRGPADGLRRPGPPARRRPRAVDRARRTGRLSAWIEEHPFVPAADQHRFAGVILVDRQGRILLQERDEHPRIDPEKWGLAGGHVDPGEDVRGRLPTASSRRRPAYASSPGRSSSTASSSSTTARPTAPGTGCRSSSPPPT